ncbi:hypothetical protein ACLFMI_16950 [Pseudonocardia nantongensis]|uniref:hypothetical protein n=1 Tax=Pseudonocardia nantongensis TaxID=1181885 RepID=UPI003979FFA9
MPAQLDGVVRADHVDLTGVQQPPGTGIDGDARVARGVTGGDQSARGLDEQAGQTISARRSSVPEPSISRPPNGRIVPQSR